MSVSIVAAPTTAGAPDLNRRLRLHVTSLGPRPAVAHPDVRLNGQSVGAVALRGWTSLRGATQYDGSMTEGWSMLLEIPVANDGDVSIEVDVPGAGSAQLRTRRVPDDLPVSELDGAFNLLLVSCYCSAEDNGLLVAETARQIHQKHGVHLSMVAGDQVYLDIPTLHDLPEAFVPLANELEAKYRANFIPDDPVRASNYAGLLQLAPVVSMPDDHEYWNNAPHWSEQNGNTWRKANRDFWWQLGHDLYTGYQGYSPSPPQGLGPFKHEIIEIGPLSIFVANTRTYRLEDLSRLLDDETHLALRAWASRLKDERKFGALVTGQSFLDEKASSTMGRFADYALANYGDFDRLKAIVDEIVRDTADVLLLTGDVHWSRVAQLTSKRDLNGEARVIEVISSPSRLVTTVGWDQLSHAWNWLTGNKDPWPRHPKEVPAASAVMELEGTPYSGQNLYEQRGDVLTLLSFSRAGGDLQVKTRFFEVGRDVEGEVKPFVLRRRA